MGCISPLSYIGYPRIPDLIKNIKAKQTMLEFIFQLHFNIKPQFVNILRSKCLSLLTVYHNSIYVQVHLEEIIFLFVSNSRYSFSFSCPKLSHMLAKGSKAIWMGCEQRLVVSPSLGFRIPAFHFAVGT